MRLRSGFTLLELMVSMSIMTLVLTVLMTLGIVMSQSIASQDARSKAQGEAAKGMMLLVREIRPAASASIDWRAFPTTTLRYRVPMDLDANGAPVDIGGFVELSPELSVGPDTSDLNGDGLTNTQLIWTDGNAVRVLANHLLNEDANGNSSLDGGEDVNRNGILDRGVLFERVNEGVLITIRTSCRTMPDRPATLARLTEVVVPRNGG